MTILSPGRRQGGSWRYWMSEGTVTGKSDVRSTGKMWGSTGDVQHPAYLADRMTNLPDRRGVLL
jgi:hypothetical protein